jgi:hypothetical protein
MPYVRTAYLSLSETDQSIQGHVHGIVYEHMHAVPEDFRIDMSFYRPGSGLKFNEWLKDVLVQVIEQL